MSSLHHRSTTIAADDPAEIKQAYNYVRNTWFKQSATRVSAESDLKNATAGSFLVRPSSKSGCMALSFKTQDRVVHSVIENSREGYFVLIAISGTGQQKKIGPFKNILQVLGKLDNLALPSFISNALKENRPIFTQPKQQQQQHHHHQQQPHHQQPQRKYSAPATTKRNPHYSRSATTGISSTSHTSSSPLQAANGGGARRLTQPSISGVSSQSRRSGDPRIETNCGSDNISMVSYWSAWPYESSSQNSRVAGRPDIESFSLATTSASSNERRFNSTSNSSGPTKDSSEPHFRSINTRGSGASSSDGRKRRKRARNSDTPSSSLSMYDSLSLGSTRAVHSDVATTEVSSSATSTSSQRAGVEAGTSPIVKTDPAATTIQEAALAHKNSNSLSKRHSNSHNNNKTNTSNNNNNNNNKNKKKNNNNQKNDRNEDNVVDDSVNSSSNTSKNSSNATDTTKNTINLSSSLKLVSDSHTSLSSAPSIGMPNSSLAHTSEAPRPSLYQSNGLLDSMAVVTDCDSTTDEHTALTPHSVAFESVRSDDSSTQKRRVSSPAALSVPTSEENTDDGEDMQSGGSMVESDTSLVGRRGSGDADGSTSGQSSSNQSRSGQSNASHASRNSSNVSGASTAASGSASSRNTTSTVASTCQSVGTHFSTSSQVSYGTRSNASGAGSGSGTSGSSTLLVNRPLPCRRNSFSDLASISHSSASLHRVAEGERASVMSAGELLLEQWGAARVHNTSRQTDADRARDADAIADADALAGVVSNTPADDTDDSAAALALMRSPSSPPLPSH